MDKGNPLKRISEKRRVTVKAVRHDRRRSTVDRRACPSCGHPIQTKIVKRKQGLTALTRYCSECRWTTTSVLEAVADCPRDITGAWVRRLRSERGLTQTQLAEVVGVIQVTVARWEQGRFVPTKMAQVALWRFSKVPTLK
jgi:DNA-binding transcriptional regulator YiaG